MNHWLDLEHKTYKQLKTLKIESKSLVLAVSGGEDSMALLELFSVLQGALRLNLAVVNIHHGGLDPFRAEAQIFVQNEATQRGISFYSFQSEKALRTEAEMREFRWRALGQIRTELKFDYVVTAHHMDDLLETRLIRMIRGVGPQGLKAMSPLLGLRLRPLLSVSKAEIKTYIDAKNLSYLRDPSNKDSRYLRNWLRNQWLPQLEKRRPGSLKSLANSLENISSQSQAWPEGLWMNGHTVSRPHWLSLSVERQMNVLAQMLLNLKMQNFTKNQLKEIYKNLDRPQNVHSFRIAHCYWKVNAKHIIASKEPFSF